MKRERRRDEQDEKDLIGTGDVGTVGNDKNKPKCGH
jgi:hypothetical protein